MLVASLLAGCSEDIKWGQTGGAVLGGIGGAVLGAQFGRGTGKLAMTALGGVLGALAGSQLGKQLDQADKVEAGKAEERAQSAPVGQSVVWTNPESGHSGTVTPVSEGPDRAGNFCREYQSTLSVDGKEERGSGIACRQPDGSWKVVN